MQPVGALTLEIGRDGAALRGVASDGPNTFTALTAGEQTTVEMRAGDRLAWHAELAGRAGPIAANNAQVFVTLGAHLRGDPGALVVALDHVGHEAWRREIDSSEWSVISSIATTKDGIVVGGSFSGTLRAGAKVVSSAGKADGFAARIDGKGEVAWLLRVGGVNVDGVTGVAASGDRIAIVGSFAPGAELQGTLLPPFDDKTPRADGFVAELDGNGARKWVQTFGGKLDDGVAGVAIDGAGRVAVAFDVREVIKVSTSELIALGESDGAIAWFSKTGTLEHVVQIGGRESDGTSNIVAVDNRIVVGGFYSGTLPIGPEKLVAGGGDDAFLAAYDGGTFAGVWPVSGDGREEIAALAAVPRGFVAGVTHTARLDVVEKLPAPKDPLSGAALVVRPVR